jgi:hypothetical protein
VLRGKLIFLLLYSEVTKWGKCKFYVTLKQHKIKTGPSHKLVLLFVFGSEEEWITKTVYAIGA